MKQIFQMVLFVTLMAGLASAATGQGGQNTDALDACLLAVPNQIKTIEGIQSLKLLLQKTSGRIVGQERPKEWEYIASPDVTECVREYTKIPDCFGGEAENLTENNVTCFQRTTEQVILELDRVTSEIKAAGLGDVLNVWENGGQSKLCIARVSGLASNVSRDFEYEYCRFIQAKLRHGFARFVQLMREDE